MHNQVYASGFLYHVPTQQILLQQMPSLSSASSVWSAFHGSAARQTELPLVFTQLIQNELGIHLAQKSIIAVYDYLAEETNKHFYVYYAETSELHPQLLARHAAAVSWFTFKQLSRLPLDPQTKQDLTVVQRVINMRQRELHQ